MTLNFSNFLPSVCNLLTTSPLILSLSFSLCAFNNMLPLSVLKTSCLTVSDGSLNSSISTCVSLNCATCSFNNSSVSLGSVSVSSVSVRSAASAASAPPRKYLLPPPNILTDGLLYKIGIIVFISIHKICAIVLTKLGSPNCISIPCFDNKSVIISVNSVDFCCSNISSSN